MPGVEINGSVPSLVIGTIGTNGTLSEEFDLTGYTLVGMLSDNATNGTLNFLVADRPLSKGNTYRPVRDNVGVAVPLTLPSGSSAFRESDIKVIAPYRFVRIFTTAAQSSAPTFTFVVKA